MESNHQHVVDEIETSQFVSIADEIHDSTDPHSSHGDLVMGETDSPEYTAEGVGDSRVALFFKLVRNIPSEELGQLLEAVLGVARSTQIDKDSSEQVRAQKATMVVDAFVMAFQTRNCRGGKGERDLFYKLITRMAMDFPNTVAAMMPLVPTYGSYKDWFCILSLAKDTANTPEDVRMAMKPTVNRIMDLVRDQLLLDQSILIEDSSSHMTKDSDTSLLETTHVSNMDEDDEAASKQKISLLSKWAPKQGNRMKALVNDLAKHIFPQSACPNRDYRKLVAALNRAIHTTETKMSSNQWDEIRFGSVPSLCMMKNRKAFLNEALKGPPLTRAQMETGNRYPEDEKRVACRKRLAEMLSDKRQCKKIKGRQLFPHEIVTKIDENFPISDMEQLLFQQQWCDIRESVIQSFHDNKNQLVLDSQSSKVMNLGKLLPVVDVSGSMNGIPMEVAIALGILASELANREFAHRIITFSESPSWVVLSPEMTIYNKVVAMRAADWGYSTNFEKVMEMILTVAKEGNLSPEQIPDLLVLSDMQFNEASGLQHAQGDHWETHHERIVRRFKEMGLEVCGMEWPTPTITYWNLRGDTVGFPAQANTPGVNMVSGYSPSLMTAILQGEDIASCEQAEEAMRDGGDTGESAKNKKNPYDTLRKILDDERYDLVRDILRQSQEGPLQYYS